MIQKKRLFVGLAVVASILVLSSPRVARAAAALLVQVTNTTANPAVTQDVSKTASQIVQLTCSMEFPSCYLPGQSFALGSPNYRVPQGQNLVITSAEIFPPSGGALYYLGLNYSSNSWAMTADGLTHDFNFPPGIVIPGGTNLLPTSSGDNPELGFGVGVFYGYLTAN